MAMMMALSGLLIIFNRQILGPLFLLIVMAFLLATTDNPYLYDHVKPTMKNKNYKFSDLFRHLSLVGAAFLIMMDRGPKQDNDQKKEKVEDDE